MDPRQHILNESGKRAVMLLRMCIEIKNKKKVKAAEFSARDALVTALETFLQQRLAVAVQRGNAACVREALERHI